VESVKTVSDIYAPISGEVIEVNGALGAQSELVNSDPYGKGYMLKLRISESSSTEDLLDAAGYQSAIH